MLTLACDAAQLAYGAITLLGYVAAYSPAGLQWLRAWEKPMPGMDQKLQGWLDWRALKLCGSFTLQVLRCLAAVR